MRTLAIGDIHGCLKALDALLAFVKPLPGDTLIALGDYVDRGPDSRGVVERLLELRLNGQLIPLRGNHEVMMLGAKYGSADELHFWLRCGGLETLQSYAPDDEFPTHEQVPDSHWHFLRHACSDWYETDSHIFVHANLHPRRALPEQSVQQLHWQPLSPRTHAPHQSGKMMVCGHTEQRNGQPLLLEQAVCIDTFAYGGGWLTCLDVASGEYWQANQAGETRQGMIKMKDD